MGFEWFWFYFVCWSSLVCSFPVFACIFLSWLYTLELSNASLVCNNLSSRWGARCSQWTIEVADVSPIPQLRNSHHQTWYQARSCKIYSIICAFLRLAAAEILPSKFTCLVTIIQDKYIYWTPSPPVRPPFVELGELPSRKLTLPPDEKWWDSEFRDDPFLSGRLGLFSGEILEHSRCSTGNPAKTATVA